MEFDIEFAWSILPDLLRGLLVTVQVVVLGFLLAVLLGLILAIAQRSPFAAPRRFCQGYLSFFRNTPLMVQLYVLFFALPSAGITLPAISTGVIGLGLYYSAYIAEAYRGAIDGVPAGQWEAARALDFDTTTTWRRIILPQALKPMLPVLGNYLIGMFKETPLLAVITIPELFQAAKQVAGMTYRYTEPYTLMAVLFLIISVPTSLLFKYLERRSHV
ncbi:ectoine/hydroxyectoine ABC transporter permease subunit EhuD [Pseudomonas gingeri NCPPB 3146 = LMG 5327]|uniref:Ectoine/hydroxyectoine ABC transporter permease subunit EhuD n=2 Tax=Pseudomonas gingeri TaxID=117681 RepID=A0A7Y7Y5L1_9PSED|nr:MULTISPECIES: ectoine/hydroxyectoine ABC transporter permease subunit EhuD [Pseudomonas]NVZ27764.1 ectoine/hydroxyectoine ABC transporter permease subunit EhuD [Pseudomonas gingeri]NWA05756.1 ectoine/hydroxyectoine ABC transporter permease subunit EhuD [Pseudomonas gingeri]NWC17588.1 ectoine/hydroxyectoine ABC transporter permease subunit EhuD [Pseudomonas gingeri]NWE72344.1 ectoine/hydroxyectoine ABC transporter permease subunit EhuD [Pseudomonas gingeri]PNQ88037.1 ectoine/hydroxyectoine A